MDDMNQITDQEKPVVNVDNEVATAKKKILKHIAVLNSSIVQVITEPTSDTRTFYNLVSRRLVSDEQLIQMAALYNLNYTIEAVSKIASISGLKAHSGALSSDDINLYADLEYTARDIYTRLFDLFTYTRNDIITDYNDLVTLCSIRNIETAAVDYIDYDTNADKHHLTYLLLKIVRDILIALGAANAVDVFDVYGEMVSLREIFGDKSLRELVDTYGMYLTEEEDLAQFNTALNDGNVDAENDVEQPTCERE